MNKEIKFKKNAVLLKDRSSSEEAETCSQKFCCHTKLCPVHRSHRWSRGGLLPGRGGSWLHQNQQEKELTSKTEVTVLRYIIKEVTSTTFAHIPLTKESLVALSEKDCSPPIRKETPDICD